MCDSVSNLERIFKMFSSFAVHRSKWQSSFEKNLSSINDLIPRRPRNVIRIKTKIALSHEHLSSMRQSLASPDAKFWEKPVKGLCPSHVTDENRLNKFFPTTYDIHECQPNHAACLSMVKRLPSLYRIVGFFP